MAGIKGRGGKKGRSGRKSKAVELGLAALVEKGWTPSDRDDCITALASQAKDPKSEHFMDAAKLLMAYAYGKPTEKHEVGGPGGGPVTVRVVYA